MRKIRPYYFSKLRTSDFLSFYMRVRSCDGIVCFDFEDSIDDPDKTLARKLKEDQRSAVVKLLKSMKLDDEMNGIGIRVNSCRSEFIQEDLDAINSLRNLHSIFLSKAEHSHEVAQLMNNLTADVEEIIPIIETRAGFDCAGEILSFQNSKLKSIAFGHCDFNLSTNCFPFHHQDSAEYWEWISFLNRKAKEAGKKLINSVVLSLNDEKLFQWVLRKLTEYPSVEGQAVLSMKQTEWCSRAQFEFSNVGVGRWKKARKPDFDIAISVVDNFQSHRLEGKSFALDKNRTVTSPQEYTAARSYLEQFNAGKNMLIVGGCLPIQYNIPKDRTYHYTLVKLLEKKHLKFDVAIIRYETLSRCLEKIMTAARNIRIDVLMFNLRTEPLVRISKILYKYVNDEGDLKRSLNLPYLGILNAERYDPLNVKLLTSDTGSKRKEKKWRHLLVEANCVFGALIGNRSFVLRKYEELFLGINKFCVENNIKLLVLGPATRPSSGFENKLAEDVNDRFSRIAEVSGISYVDVMGTHDESGNDLFFENGIHVSQAGHDRMAKMLFEKMLGEVL
ncbi:MAG TPA: aldolase/citrate lyase family protein [Candidatus Acidoferrales bacterium]|nr:aldolase/citrate lyase family protein [Candidatus Acidoferrales bacterium]